VSEARRWLLLVHQIPPAPAYLRVKTGRRLGRMGAHALKNTVYVLPHGSAHTEDFQWVRREIVDGGGDATIVEASLVEGVSDDELEEQFRAARDLEYESLVADARSLEKTLEKKGAGPDTVASAEAEVARLERRLEEIVGRDFFRAAGRDIAERVLLSIRGKLRKDPKRPTQPRAKAPRAATWVTRAGVHVDRIASAWLIQRFIDPDATFKFVSPKGYRPAKGELRFDMFEAEFSHEGDACTFETLCGKFGIDAPGIQPLAEIVHDIDLKDGKFGRPETAGVASMIAGLALRHREDTARLERGFALFDDLCAYFERRNA
jgi:hypothetical protein